MKGMDCLGCDIEIRAYIMVCPNLRVTWRITTVKRCDYKCIRRITTRIETLDERLPESLLLRVALTNISMLSLRAS